MLRSKAQQLEEYKEQGYTVVPNVLAEDQLEKVLRDINAVFSAQLESCGKTPKAYTDQTSLLSNMKILLQHDVQLYLSCARHIPKLLSLQALTSSESILSLANDFGLRHPSSPTSPVVHISSEELKIPNGYYGVGAHQDWPSIQGGLKSIVVWIPFMDISSTTFPLEIIPQSHKLGLMKGNAEANIYEVDEGLIDEGQFVRPILKFGDVVVMSVFALHRTGIANSQGFRMACSMRYEDSLESSFVKRGYPCAYQRSVNRDFITPGFPALEEVEEVFK